MMGYHPIKKAQSTIEYAMLVACLIAALLCIQHYLKRAAQGKLREAADSIAEQYDAHHVTSDITFSHEGETTTTSDMVEELYAEAEEGKIFGIRTTTELTDEEKIKRKGSEVLEAFPDDLFD